MTEEKFSWIRDLLPHLIFIIIFILFNIFLKQYVIYLGTFYITIFCIFWFIKNRNYYILIPSIIFLGLTTFIFIRKIYPSWAVVFLIVAFILVIILLNVKKTIVGFLSILILLLYIIKIMPALYTIFFNEVFQIKIPNSFYLTLIAILFTFFVVFSFCNYTFNYLLKLKRFEKLNNIYFTMSCTLIIFILFGGIIGIRELYKDKFPINLIFEGQYGSDTDFIDYQKTICYGDTYDGKMTLFPIEKKKIICYVNLSLKQNYSSDFIFQDVIVEVQKEVNEWENYFSKNNKTLFYYNKEKDNILITFWLDKEYSQYRITLSFKNIINGMHLSPYARIQLDILTVKEYNDKIERRNSLITAIFAVILFSVFSAMSNLKSILEDSGSNRI